MNLFDKFFSYMGSFHPVGGIIYHIFFMRNWDAFLSFCDSSLIDQKVLKIHKPKALRLSKFVSNVYNRITLSLAQNLKNTWEKLFAADSSIQKDKNLEWYLRS